MTSATSKATAIERAVNSRMCAGLTGGVIPTGDVDTESPRGVTRHEARRRTALFGRTGMRYAPRHRDATTRTRTAGVQVAPARRLLNAGGETPPTPAAHFCGRPTEGSMDIRLRIKPDRRQVLMPWPPQFERRHVVKAEDIPTCHGLGEPNVQAPSPERPPWTCEKRGREVAP